MKGNQTARAQKPDVASRRSPARSRYRILVAEENPQLRLRYAFALVRPGYDVDVAEDGAAAWEALQAKRYHLLITENDLPRLTGVDLVKKLRAARMALPIVMAAEKLPTDELARDPSLRLAATLAKPFPLAELLEAVKTILRA